MTVCNSRGFGRGVGVVGGWIRAIALVVVVLVGHSRAQAQCPAGWRPFDPSTATYPGVTAGGENSVYASTYWDPDGPGPLMPRLIIGGRFVIAGNVRANRIAAYNPGTGQWSPLGTGVANGYFTTVHALTTLPNGDLIAAGDFTTAGGVPANNIARWNGSAWSPLGTGVTGGNFSNVYALTTLPNGDLIAAGDFTTAGGVPANNIARWNGSTWSQLGTGTGSSVYSLTTLPNGDLIAGGTFQNIGPVFVNCIARWNGSTWSPLGGGLYNQIDPFSRVSTLVTLPNGDLIAGGTFTIAGGVRVKNIARWNGSAWSAIGVVPNSNFNSDRINSIAPLPNGDLIVGGDFTIIGGVPAVKVARWNGSAWSALGDGINDPDSGAPFIQVRTLTTLPNGELFAGGYFTRVGGVTAMNIARWNGINWSPFGTGLAGTVQVLTTLANGDLIAGGNFTSVGGVAASKIARWNGSAWSPLGAGMNSNVNTLTTLPNGDLIAGGTFTAAGGAPASRIARWTGSAWSPLGTGMNNTVWAVTTMPNGDLIAGGDFTTAGGVAANYIARWNGSAWFPLGAGMNNRVSALTTLPNGDLIAGGSFTTAGGVAAITIARWNGSTWSPLGTGMQVASPNSPSVGSLVTLPNGDLIAGGYFSSAGGVFANNIARWNGSAWSPIGAGSYYSVWALTTLPSGELVAASSSFIDIWNGTTWSPVGAVYLQDSSTPNIYDIGVLPNGDLIVGGTFLSAGVNSSAAAVGVIAPFIARYSFVSTPAPTIATHPVPQSACVAGSAAFAVTPAGTGPFTYQWRKGVVAINATTNPSAATATLTLANVQAGDAGSYDCVVSTPCGSVTSNAVSFTLAVCACGLSDVAGPGQSIGSDSTLTADDIIVYLNWFFAGDTRADVAGPGQSSVPDSQFTADDIIVFLNRFFAGC